MLGPSPLLRGVRDGGGGGKREVGELGCWGVGVLGLWLRAGGLAFKSFSFVALTI